MDFVQTWKTISIGMTGAFGVLGLLTNFKDKVTGRVTVWGYISLCGILISTAFGVAAQLAQNVKESDQAARNAESSLQLAKRTQATVENTSVALREIQRTLYSLDNLQLSLKLEIPCQTKEYSAVCKRAREADSLAGDQKRIWEVWPDKESFLPFMIFYVRFFKEDKDVATYAAGNSLQGGDLDFVFSVDRSNNKSGASARCSGPLF